MEDLYQTIAGPSEGLFKDKGSRFIAKAYPVESVEQVKEILASLRKEYHDARHHCYAYRIGANGIQYRANDDGEPANSAGKPILGQLQSQNLTNILIVVIRYFGGILLGVGGLIQAYRSAAKNSLDQATIIQRHFETTILIRFPYLVMNEVMKLIKDSRAEMISQDFGEGCQVGIRVRQSLAEGIINQLNHIESVNAVIVNM